MENHTINHNDALKFILAGKSTFTVLNPLTKNRYTFLVKKAKNMDLSFVSVLTGPDNNTHYTYIGIVKDGKFQLTEKSKLKSDSVSVRTFKYIINKLSSNSLDSFIEILHEGKCGKCGKKLTTPNSIKTGYGIKCFKLMQLSLA